MKKILAITPYFGKSGSELALFNLLDSVKIKLNISIYINNKNPSLRKYLDDNITFIDKYKTSSSRFFLLTFIFKKIKLYLNIKAPKNELDRVLNEEKYDCVILNTLLSLVYMQDVMNRNVNVIVYVHETEDLLVRLNKIQLNYLINEVGLVLCSSNYVKNYLVSIGRRNNIEVLYPSLDFSKFSLPIKKNNIRKDLGFNKNDFLWAMSGDLTINKNPKMFVDIAKHIVNIKKNVCFLWIGTSGDSAYEVFLEQKVKEFDLTNRVKFISKKYEDYYSYINEIDGLLLTSLSESYSLVAKESACFNKPVVSFDCGGIYEAVPKESLFVSKKYSIKEITNLMLLVMESDKKVIEDDDFDFLFSNEKGIISKRFLDLISGLKNEV